MGNLRVTEMSRRKLVCAEGAFPPDSLHAFSTLCFVKVLVLRLKSSEVYE